MNFRERERESNVAVYCWSAMYCCVAVDEWNKAVHNDLLKRVNMKSSLVFIGISRKIKFDDGELHESSSQDVSYFNNTNTYIHVRISMWL